MISIEAASELALSDACEDYFGLYELIWEFNTKFPDASSADRLAAAQTALSSLVQEQLVALYHTKWASSRFVAVPATAVTSILEKATSWEPPANTGEGGYYCFASTPAGDSRYQQRRET